MLARFIICSVCIWLLYPASIHAQNAGIVRGLWFSQEQFFANQKIRVYVAIRNNSGSDLSGTVEFFVDGTRIERTNIDALDGRIVESWADWKPNYGTSTITATLSRTELSSTASGTTEVTVTSALAEETIFVDRDTDGDLIGNAIDTDDDGDGIADVDDERPEQYDAPTPTDNDETNEPTEPVTPTTVDNTVATDPAGLEQFLTPSRVDSSLQQITETITNTKRRLDTYRSDRTAAQSPPVVETDVSQPAASTSAASSTIGSTSINLSPSTINGFGDVTRTTAAQASNGWLDKLWHAITTALGGVYTLLLFLASSLLGHPIIVQLLLLFLILFILFKVARRLGGRPD